MFGCGGRGVFGLVSELTIARAAAAAGAEDPRFLLKTVRTTRWIVEVSLAVAARPAPSVLHVSLTDRADGAFLECEPRPLNFYVDAFALAGAVKATDAEVQVLPKASFTAQLTARMHGGPLIVPVSAFTRRPRPVFSGLVRYWG